MPNEVQKKYSLKAGKKNIVLKARQMGISTWIAARFFISTILKPGTLTALVAHDARSAADIFRIVDRFWRYLPDHWKKEQLKRTVATKEQMIFGNIDSEYRIETAGDPEAGRGLTIQNLHCSEVARWPSEQGLDPMETLAALRAAVVPGGEIVLESTPKGASGVFYDEWNRAPETGYAQHFFPWWEESGYVSDAAIDRASLSTEESVLMTRHNLSLPQMAFRRELRTQHRDLAVQEFAEDAESCFLASGDCVFEIDLIEKRLKEPEEPARITSGIKTWLEPVAGRKYVIGVDSSEGIKHGDYSCAQVIDCEKALQCAELHGTFSPAILAGKVAKLAREYNGAVVAVEANNHGHSVIESLSRHEKYERLFATEKRVGWYMSQLNRPPLIARLGAIFTECPELFKSHGLLREMRSFVNLPSGKQAAAAGAFDDRVMAMGIALAVREQVAGK